MQILGGSAALQIRQQMAEHTWSRDIAYDAHACRGYEPLRPIFYSATEEDVRNFRGPLDQRRDIRDMLFGGFRRCLYPIQKFDADPERRFAEILETDTDVLK